VKNFCSTKVIYTTFTKQETFEKCWALHYCEPPLHCQSPGVASRTPAIAIAQAACDVHNDDNDDDDDDDNDNA